MRKWITLIAILFIFIICGSPTAPNREATVHAAWVKCIPNWDHYDMETQDQIMHLYELSPNKHLWFPDSFPKQYPGIFIIYP